jgi:hypothetical protein
VDPGSGPVCDERDAEELGYAEEHHSDDLHRLEGDKCPDDGANMLGVGDSADQFGEPESTDEPGDGEETEPDGFVHSGTAWEADFVEEDEWVESIERLAGGAAPSSWRRSPSVTPPSDGGPADSFTADEFTFGHEEGDRKDERQVCHPAREHWRLEIDGGCEYTDGDPEEKTK